MNYKMWLGCAAMAMVASLGFAEGKGVNILEHKVKDIKGDEVQLKEKFDGKVLLVVNVASKCGLTPQYEQLVELHKKYKDEGLEILGFPANDFMSQEPGSNEEILAFCKKKYDVDFPMFSKVSVIDPDKAPLFKDLTSTEKNKEFGGEIKWNFTKFLVDRKGNVIARFEPRTKPDSPEVVEAIETALKDK